MHSLPQDGIGVPYVHDDRHNLYRPVNQSDVKVQLQVHCEWGCWAHIQGLGSDTIDVVGPNSKQN